MVGLVKGPGLILQDAWTFSKYLEKISSTNCEKYTILAYFSKIFKNPEFSFRPFGIKLQLVGNFFQKYVKRIHYKNCTLNYFWKVCCDEESLLKYLIFLQQFCPLRWVWRLNPLSHLFAMRSPLDRLEFISQRYFQSYIQHSFSKCAVVFWNYLSPFCPVEKQWSEHIAQPRTEKRDFTFLGHIFLTQFKWNANDRWK